MKNCPSRFACLLAVCLMAVQGQAQTMVWDSLQMKEIPAGWSRQTQADRISYSNYNIKEQTPLMVTLLRGRAAGPRPDLDFQAEWRRMFNLPDTAACPRPRRLYAEDGSIVFAGGAEFKSGEKAGFHALYLFWKKTYTQAVWIEAPNLLAWRPVQYDWEESMRQSSWIVVKK